eukprot:TRINITY_DN82531_c0_g1_i1.p1 TRINITY_DN82531_c0_g1~~TRINITY_DN82531_c0_g1_i1.p1  ORF type:complete len:510 (-),score=108.19 TRINITY_DN82531_c0_g1_i1:53-1582(-)
MLLGLHRIAMLWEPIATTICYGSAVLAISLLATWLFLRWRVQNRSSSGELAEKLEGKETLGFFHPYCAAGGGGERVLWCAIDAVQREHKGVQCIVYTGDVHTDAKTILEQAAQRFGVKVQADSVHFVFLQSRRWVEASTWPRFTLLGQSGGSLLLGYEALCEFVPDVMLETMGYAFTYPLFRLVGGCRVGCYVHYPTISTDMLMRVKMRDQQAVCNDALVAKSSFLSQLKLMYYHVFAFLYGIAGSFAEVVMCNSSWTRGHIDNLWLTPENAISTVYPPCDTSALSALPLERKTTSWKGPLIVSLAQFRPEKDHSKQLRSFARFLQDCPQYRSGPAEARVRLVVAGGCRDSGDASRLAALQQLATELGLRERREKDTQEDWDVDFRQNIPLEEVRDLLSQATVGLHTMRDEHFGISVVEFMAAGAIPLAHDSAGPRMDIVRPLDGKKTGFLATDEASYAKALADIFALSSGDRLEMTAAGRHSVAKRFSQEAFEDKFASGMVAPLRKSA